MCINIIMIIKRVASIHTQSISWYAVGGKLGAGSRYDVKPTSMTLKQPRSKF